MRVIHEFESAKSDGGDDTLVRPSDWNADHVVSFIGCVASASATQSIGANDFFAVVFDAADEIDTNSFHDPGSNNTRFTAPFTGKYRVDTRVYFSSGGNPTIVGISVSGSYKTPDSRRFSAGVGHHDTSRVVTCTASQYIEVMAYSSSAQNLNTGNSGEKCQVTITYLGA